MLILYQRYFFIAIIFFEKTLIFIDNNDYFLYNIPTLREYKATQKVNKSTTDYQQFFQKIPPYSGNFNKE